MPKRRLGTELAVRVLGTRSVTSYTDCETTAHETRDHTKFTAAVLRQVREYPAALSSAREEHDRQQNELWNQTMAARSGWERSTATPSPPNSLHRRLKFDVEQHRREFFKTKGNPSALDLLPYLDKIRAGTFDPMHLVLIGLMKVFCIGIFIEGLYGGTEDVYNRPKKMTKAQKRKAMETNQQLLDASAGASEGLSEQDIANLREHLENQMATEEKDDVAKRKGLYAVFRSEDVHELSRLMNEVGHLSRVK
jgi:hypothetical protein